MKEVQKFAFTPKVDEVKVADIAKVTSDDNVEYYFSKPEWEDAWLFSHRKYPDEDGRVNCYNHPLPQSIVAWANEHLGKWDYDDGKTTYKKEMGNYSIVITREF